MKAYLEYVVQLRDEAMRLRELVEAFNTRYQCGCKHNRCKRCELNRKADAILGGDQ